MAFLKTYVVTSGISPEEMKDEIVKRLAAAEEMNENGELGFAFTFDYTSKKIYMIFSNQMVEKDDKITENMVEVQSNSSDLINDQISRINRTLKILVDGDGSVISKPSTPTVPDNTVDLTAINEKLTLLEEKLLALESKQLNRADIIALVRNEIAGAGDKEPESPDPVPGGSTPSGDGTSSGSGEGTGGSVPDGGSDSSDSKDPAGGSTDGGKPDESGPTTTPTPQAVNKFYVGVMNVPAGNQDYDFTSDIQANLTYKEEFVYDDYVGTATPLNIAKQANDDFVWIAFEDGKENVELNTDSGFNPANVVAVATNTATITADLGNGEKTYKVLVISEKKTGTIDPLYLKTK